MLKIELNINKSYKPIGNDKFFESYTKIKINFS